MWQIVTLAVVGHLLALFLAIFALRFLHRYTARRFHLSGVHCPTQLAAEGQYEAPPRGLVVLFLMIQLVIPRLIFLTTIIGSYLILVYDFGLLVDDFNLVQQAWLGVETAGGPGHWRSN